MTSSRISRDELWEGLPSKNDFDNLSTDDPRNFLRLYKQNQFFEPGEGGAKQVDKDYIQRNFLCEGEKKQSMPEFDRTFGADAEKIKAGHSQGLGAALQEMLVGRVKDKGCVLNPNNQTIFANLFKEQDQVCFSYKQALDVCSSNDPNQIYGQLGPVEARYKLKQNNLNGKWGFELEHIETTDPLAERMYRGENVSSNELKEYCLREKKDSLDDIRKDHEDLEKLTKVCTTFENNLATQLQNATKIPFPEGSDLYMKAEIAAKTASSSKKLQEVLSQIDLLKEIHPKKNPAVSEKEQLNQFINKLKNPLVKDKLNKIKKSSSRFFSAIAHLFGKVTELTFTNKLKEIEKSQVEPSPTPFATRPRR